MILKLNFIEKICGAKKARENADDGAGRPGMTRYTPASACQSFGRIPLSAEARIFESPWGLGEALARVYDLEAASRDRPTARGHQGRDGQPPQRARPLPDRRQPRRLKCRSSGSLTVCSIFPCTQLGLDSPPTAGNPDGVRTMGLYQRHNSRAPLQTTIYTPA